ncbi:putative ribonuclease H-like domain-containing protein [Rosa chinensis]|uniref:Putative ribonuclease H-like domain-containing protein n=1 Tax=Rosa chinensis TaxID=74649 RepID=A0A2P6PGK8_ROSCH|nr:uncharacterized protein LOC112179390 [Rosa chinensis]PRQ21049.1 putative ribonuclease H-like domain-containing protein [Rosa chinensis]
MGWLVFLKLSAKFFTVLSWPSFSLVYALYASIQAVQSDSHSRNQRCLAYWVLFALYKISESTLAKLFYWLPLWPYTKGVITVLLVLPYFHGASYLYEHFIRSYISEYSFIWKWNFLSIPRVKGIFSRRDSYPDVVDKSVISMEPQELAKPVIFQGIPASSSEAIARESALPSSPKKIQREWSCALCLINASSENCLKEHIQGKKHVLQVEALRVRQVPVGGYKSSLKLKRTNGRVLLDNLNQIARANLEKWGGILRPIRLCRWKKPEVGWTKLNTDGSVVSGNAGFGGLLRNYKGEPICAFVSKALGDDIFSVELWAIWRGLVLASGLGIKVIWVESDSLSVVKTINRDQPYSMKAGSCLKHIWDLLKKFDKHCVSHSWRETNRAADHLSKMVLSVSDVVFWPGDFPDSLNKIIKEDAEGRIYCRS